MLYLYISMSCLLVGTILALLAVFLWFRCHIYRIIQDLSGNSRIRQVQHLKNNSMLLGTQVYGNRMDHLNELVDAYLLHDTTMVEVETDDLSPITEILIAPECMGYNVERIIRGRSSGFTQFGNVILPLKEDVTFKVTRSEVVVNWADETDEGSESRECKDAGGDVDGKEQRK